MKGVLLHSFLSRRITMSKKEISDPTEKKEDDGYPMFALSLVVIVVLAVLLFGLKAFGVL
jgi:hypothetical protein